MPECANCGAHVTERYVAVFEPDGVEAPKCCPFCPDLVRDGPDARDARSGRGNRASGAKERDQYGRFVSSGGTP